MTDEIRPTWGRFDYEDWHNSWAVQAMSWLETGLYFQLLALQFKHGAISSDPKINARMLGVGTSGAEYELFEATFEVVVEQFEPVDGDERRLQNPRQAEERAVAVRKLQQKIRAGRASGKARRTKKKERSLNDRSNARSNDRSNARSTDAATKPELDVDIEEETSTEDTSLRSASSDAEASKSNDRSNARSTGVQHELIERPDPPPTRQVTPRFLVGEWIQVHGDVRPSDRAIRKQGAIAKRICEAYDDNAILTACAGMQELYPFSDGRPWDLMDLEKHFERAVRAAVQPPRTSSGKDLSWLDDIQFDEGG